MSIKEVLEITAAMLNNISVPVGMMKTVGEQIATAAGNLQACIDALNRDEGGKEAEGDGNPDAE